MTTSAPATEHHPAPTHTRVAVVGTGFAGLGASIALSRAGIDHVVLEKADDLGGTCRDTTHPFTPAPTTVRAGGTAWTVEPATTPEDAR